MKLPKGAFFSENENFNTKEIFSNLEICHNFVFHRFKECKAKIKFKKIAFEGNPKLVRYRLIQKDTLVKNGKNVRVTNCTCFDVDIDKSIRHGVINFAVHTKKRRGIPDLKLGHLAEIEKQMMRKDGVNVFDKLKRTNPKNN